MSPGRIPTKPLIQGNIDLFQPVAPGQGQLAGWLFREDIPFDTIDITLKNKPWVSGLRLQRRPDVQAAFEPLIGACPSLVSCGFDVTAPLPDGITAGPETLIQIAPILPAGLRLDPLLTYYCAYQDELERVPQPPALLQERVGGSKDFLSVGVHAASLVMTCVAKFKPDFQAGIILDWGCGCGRIISQLKKFVPPGNLYGCDIDSSAIEWDLQNIPEAKFLRVRPYPPTPYADRSFDVIYGISVMTHLDEDTQILWLKELQRIARSGAILALSVIGERLRKTNMPPSLKRQFDDNGFVAFVPPYSDMLSAFSHQGYYKEAYHTVDYIAETWGRYFEVLEYVETKHQDIVILRAP
ncbi:MAG: class I SAM-dependent methyltransferase [Chthoniobacterales bacterium]